MRTIAIPQLYCGASGKKGAYNRQEVGLARAFAALGCRAVVLYPDPDAAPEAVTSEDLEPNVRIYYVPVPKYRQRAHNVRPYGIAAKPKPIAGAGIARPAKYPDIQSQNRENER